MLVDGVDMVLDLEAGAVSRLVGARDGAAVRDDERVLMPRSVRCRPALTVSVQDVSAGVATLDRVLTRLKEVSA